MYRCLLKRLHLGFRGKEFAVISWVVLLVSGIVLIHSVLFKPSLLKLFNFLTLGCVLLVAIFCLHNSLDK